MTQTEDNSWIQRLPLVLENNNRPIGGKHWLLRDAQVKKDIKDFISAELRKQRQDLLEEIKEKAKSLHKENYNAIAAAGIRRFLEEFVKNK